MEDCLKCEKNLDACDKLRDKTREAKNTLKKIRQIIDNQKFLNPALTEIKKLLETKDGKHTKKLQD